MNSRMRKPENFRMEFKRDFGQTFPIQLGDRKFLPEDLYTELFRHMKACAEKACGEQITLTYLTHPAAYGKSRIEKLRSAAKAAGLFAVETVDEPTAAAMSYCAAGYVQDGETLLVYDFGGGTFDVSLIRYEDGVFTSLGNPEGLEQCGGIDIVVCQTAPVASFVPEMAVFDLPMVFSQYDGDTIDQVLNDPDSEFFIQLSQAYEEKDLHLLGFLQNGTYRITTANRPLYTLEDYHNLQIRTMENSNHMEFWSAIGANPTPLAFSELYFTLSSGGIDAQENAADSCVGINLQEVQDYLACTNHILYANQIAISKESYDALPAEYQQALEQAVSEAIAEIRPQLTQLDEDSKQIMVDSGIELIEYDDSFFQEILALDSVTALYDQINEDVNGLGTILQEALAEAAAEQAE